MFILDKQGDIDGECLVIDKIENNNFIKISTTLLTVNKLSTYSRTAMHILSKHSIKQSSNKYIHV